MANEISEQLSDPAPLLDRVVERYLTSGDFNGLYIDADSQHSLAEATGLVRSGLVQVVSERDYLNPHIRPWASQFSTEEQIAELERALRGEGYGACLYPTPQAMETRLDPLHFVHAPYSRRMAEGGGTLECAYFKFEVLEAYRNDPRYEFIFDDFGARLYVSDEVFLSDDEPESDKTSLEHVGFAYDFSNKLEGPIQRYVCVFLGDLAELSEVHQRRWQTYEVPEKEGLQPHPVWVASQMGHWPDGIGPFQEFFLELQSWNELNKAAYGVDLLADLGRPREFGWILRSSQHEFDAFIVQLDKLLSDNIRHEALDLLGAPRKDEQDQNIGTLRRLELFLGQIGIPEDVRKDLLKPLRDVRSARQKPAHVIRANVTSVDVVQPQVDLLQQVIRSLGGLRRIWQQHPGNKDWAPPDYSKDAKRYRL